MSKDIIILRPDDTIEIKDEKEVKIEDEYMDDYEQDGRD